MKRRDFLRATGGVALFNVLPRSLIAGSGATPPSETVCVAAIGAGGRAGADINGLAGAGARIVGLCDVDDRRSGGMRKKFPQAPYFKYYREMLDRLDKEIDAVLERRRNYAAELVPHKGPAVKGNIVHIDYEGLLDGKPFQGGSAQNQTLQLGSGRMIPGFEDGILGHKGGEEFEIHVTFPARYHVKDLAGKPVVFKIKLLDVCVRQLPALNSDFAKKVGKVDTMEAFREQVRKQLHDGKHASALNRAKDQVLTQLASAAEGEIPSVLVESTYQQEMQNIQQQLQMQRMSLDRYLSQIHQTRENFTANVHAAAEKNTRARMALLQVAQNEGLVPTDEEITKNLQERADRTKKTLEEVKANANIPAMQRSEAIRRAADWVIEHSTIEEK